MDEFDLGSNDDRVAWKAPAQRSRSQEVAGAVGRRLRAPIGVPTWVVGVTTAGMLATGGSMVADRLSSGPRYRASSPSPSTMPFGSDVSLGWDTGQNNAMAGNQRDCGHNAGAPSSDQPPAVGAYPTKWRVIEPRVIEQEGPTLPPPPVEVADALEMGALICVGTPQQFAAHTGQPIEMLEIYKDAPLLVWAYLDARLDEKKLGKWRGADISLSTNEIKLFRTMPDRVSRQLRLDDGKFLTVAMPEVRDEFDHTVQLSGDVVITVNGAQHSLTIEYGSSPRIFTNGHGTVGFQADYATDPMDLGIPAADVIDHANGLGRDITRALEDLPPALSGR